MSSLQATAMGQTRRVGMLMENFGAYPDPWLGSSQRRMHLSGHNVGNFAFWHAASKILGGEKVLFGFGAKPDAYAGKIDVIYIPAANFLNHTSDLGWLADFIEALDVPCLMLGLGAQSEKDDGVPELTPGTLRFLETVSKRCPTIGVRGAYSKRVCEHYGITNVEVLGCPSILINPNMALGTTIQEKWERQPVRLAVHAACIKGHVRNVERRLFEYLDLFPGSSYIIQRPQELMKLIFSEKFTETEETYLKRCAEFLAPHLSVDEFSTKIRRHGIVPYSIESWIAFNSHHTHAVGTRIHGTILSLSAEIPGICITHDTRTKELCDTLNVPSMSFGEVRTDRNNPAEMFRMLKFDGAAFDANRIRLAQRNVALITEAGIPPSNHLLSFIKSR